MLFLSNTSGLNKSMNAALNMCKIQKIQSVNVFVNQTTPDQSVNIWNLACSGENCFNFCNNKHVSTCLTAVSGPVLFSATGCQCFLNPLQATHLPNTGPPHHAVHVCTGANAVTVTVESLGAFFNTTCTLASHVTEQGQWGWSKLWGNKNEKRDRKQAPLCGLPLKICFKWVSSVLCSVNTLFTKVRILQQYKNTLYK